MQPRRQQRSWQLTGRDLRLRQGVGGAGPPEHRRLVHRALDDLEQVGHVVVVEQRKVGAHGVLGHPGLDVGVALPAAEAHLV